MGFYIKYEKVMSGWSIVYIEGSQVVISPQNIVCLSLKIDFASANSVDQDEMLHYVAFHLGLHCLPNYRFWGLWFTKD